MALADKDRIILALCKALSRVIRRSSIFSEDLAQSLSVIDASAENGYVRLDAIDFVLFDLNKVLNE